MATECNLVSDEQSYITGQMEPHRNIKLAIMKLTVPQRRRRDQLTSLASVPPTEYRRSLCALMRSVLYLYNKLAGSHVGKIK